MVTTAKTLQIKRLILASIVIALCGFGLPLVAQGGHDGHDHSGHSHHDHSGHDHSHDHHGHDHGTHDGHNHADHAGHDHSAAAKGSHDGHHASPCGGHGSGEFDPGATAFHHISDANVYSIGPFSIPLPCILYAPGKGFSFFSSGNFDIHGAHGDGNKAIDGYVLNGGSVMRVKDGQGFPDGEVQLVEGGHDHSAGGHHASIYSIDHDTNQPTMAYNGKCYELERKSTADGGLFGGGITSFFDFSLTKNVVAMLIVVLILGFLFSRVAKAYRERDGQAPSGLQSLIEPVFVFIQDEVAKPFLGHHWERFLPLLMSIFFFILGLNLFGQVPFLGGANVTGNLAVTMVLALVAFFVVNFNGNKHYWEHVFWMPGVPAWVKTILTPVELAGVFIKPITLMLRLFANITAGHMVVIIFVSLIFVFSKSGANPAAGYGTAIASTLLTLFMMAIELIVAFIQAFVFTILTASYIGAATEEAHH